MLIVGLVSSVIRAEIQEEENVLVLTTSNFEEVESLKALNVSVIKMVNKIRGEFGR